MKAVNLTRQTVLVQDVKLADSPCSRMVGLLGRQSLPLQEGLLITQCNSIHMFFMRFSIDVAFLDKSNRVVGIVHNIPPFGLSPIYWKAASALELPAGTLARSQTALLDQIVFE